MWSPEHGWWMVIWWIVVAAGIGWVVWVTIQVSRRRADDATAEERLRRRYAVGEIDEAEYHERLSVLLSSRR